MGKVEIHVPNRQYNGLIGDIRFHNGVGQIEDVKKAKEIAAQFGFEVIIPEGVVTEEAAPEKPKRKPRKKAAKAGE
jgi:hypothetical protein